MQLHVLNLFEGQDSTSEALLSNLPETQVILFPCHLDGEFGAVNIGSFYEGEKKSLNHRANPASDFSPLLPGPVSTRLAETSAQEDSLQHTQSLPT